LWLNNMTTNLPAKTATAIVVPAAAGSSSSGDGGGRKWEKGLDGEAVVIVAAQ
jgi:hypothetical protein